MQTSHQCVLIFTLLSSP